MNDKYLDEKTILAYELRQKREEGARVEAMEEKVEKEVGSISWEKLDDFNLKSVEVSSGMFEELYDLVFDLPGDFADSEPSDLQKILTCSPNKEEFFPVNFAELSDKIRGAWLGRSAGCMLGKPVEGWAGYTGKEKIKRYLKEANAYPLRNYFPPPERPDKYKLRHGSEDALLPNLDHVVRDDDIDYPILNLKLVEKFGKDFTSIDVAKTWLEYLPFHKTYTAERVAYKNFVNGISPPESSKRLNPYREWIGAQIRADLFGWINPGEPLEAANQAYRDAICTHRGNGVYGAMSVAAMLARAASEDTPTAREIIETGLSVIPEGSRLSIAIKKTMDWAKQDDDWNKTFVRVIHEYGSYHWIHTIINMAIVILSLIHGEGDFEESVAVAVMCGQDADCNSATVGSILGLLRGAEELPSKWVSPLNDKVNSIIAGDSINTISGLSERTLALSRE